MDAFPRNQENERPAQLRQSIRHHGLTNCQEKWGKGAFVRVIFS
jgi:hypothetical protein